jgi:hypothetical protein
VIAFAITAQVTAAQGPRVRPGRYKIQNVASDKFMDIDRNDGSIRRWEFGNQRSQLWDIEVAANGYVYIRSAENGMLLDIAGDNPRDEARLILAPQSGSQSQLLDDRRCGRGAVSNHIAFWQMHQCARRLAGQRSLLATVAADRGYYDGYDSCRADFSQMQSGEKQSYDAGYRYGRQDYQERRNPNYTRYADRFDPPPEPYFRRGYEDGLLFAVALE